MALKVINLSDLLQNVIAFKYIQRIKITWKDEYIGDFTGSIFMARSNFLFLANSLLKLADGGCFLPHWSTHSSQNIPSSGRPFPLYVAHICDFSLERPFLTYFLRQDSFLPQHQCLHLLEMSPGTLTTLPWLPKPSLNHSNWDQCLSCSIFMMAFIKLHTIWWMVLLEDRGSQSSVDGY